MKRFTALLVGACLTATIASAANQATSVNMVGFVNSTISSSKLNFVSLNLKDITSNKVFGTLIGDQLPVNSFAYFWNASSQTWNIATKSGKTGWGTFANRTISVGEGFFIKAPSNMTVSIAGEVPVGTNTTYSLVTGFNAFGYVYPVDTVWSNTALSQLPVNSKLNIWDASNNTWNLYLRSGKTGWGTAAGLTIRAGQGFFVNVANPTNVVEVRPFTP